MASTAELAIVIAAKDLASRELQTVTGHLSGIERLSRAATVAFAAMGAGIVASIGLGIKAAGDLEQAVANISTIKPELDTSDVFRSLNAMQTRVPQSAAQLGDSLYNIFSSIEISQEGALRLLETFAKGAVGAATDASTFGTAILGVMNAYGASVEDASHISDVFFNTVNKGVVTGSELAANLGLVTQSAKMAGVDIDELGGFIAGVTKEGGPASQNMNNLSNLFLKINTKEAQKAFRDIGIATVDATGKFRPQIEVLQDLKLKTDSMTESAKTAAIQKIFPDLQARAAATVLLDQLDFVKGAIDENKQAAGSAESAFIKMNATFNSQVKILGNTMQSILTTVGASILPALTPMLTAFSTTLPKAFEALRGVFLAFSVDAGGLGITMTSIREIFGDTVANAVEPFLNSLMRMIPDIKKWADDIWSAVSDTVGAAFNWLANTAWPWVQDAAGKVMDFYRSEVQPRLDELRGWLQDKVGTALKWLSDTAWPWLQEAAGKVAAFVKSEVIPRLIELWNWLNERIGSALKWLSDTAWPWLQEAAGKVATFFETTVIPALISVWNWLNTQLRIAVVWMTSTGFPELAKAGVTLSDSLNNVAKAAAEATDQFAKSQTLKDLNTIWTNLWESGRLLIDIFLGLFKSSSDSAGGMDKMADAGRIVVSVFEWIIGRVAVLSESIRMNIQAFKDLQVGWQNLHSGLMQGARNLGDQIHQGLTQGLLGNIGGVEQAGASVGRAALDGAREAVDAHSASRKFADLGEDMGAGLVLGWLSMGSALQKAVSDQMGLTAKDAETAAKQLADDIARGLDTAANALFDFQDKLTEFRSNLDYNLMVVGQRMGEGINRAIVSASEQIKAAQDRAVTSIGQAINALELARSIRGRRSEFEAGLTKEEREFNRGRDLDELDYRHKQDLERAKTGEERQAADERYQQGLEDLHRRQDLDDAARKFREGLDKRRQDFADKLENEALERTKARIQQERDDRIGAINQAMDTQIAKVTETAEKETKKAREEYVKRVADLSSEMIDKIPDLTGRADISITTFLAGISAKITAMTDQAISQAGGAATALAGLGGGESTSSAPPARRSSPFPGFATGGIVPGSVGVPMLAVVHGGERVIPNGGGAGGVTVIFQGPVYGLDDFEQRVGQAAERGLRNGSWRVVNR